MKKPAFAAHKVRRDQITALHDNILVHEMAFDGRKLSSGIILLNDDGKGYGIRPRWGKVYAVGPEQQDVTIGQWIMVAHGRWTRGLKIEDESGELTIRKIDPNDILLVSDSIDEPQDDTQSDAIHIDKQTT
jgi:hypothetical protein